MLVAHPRGEDCMRKVLATLVALSLVMAMFTGVFAPVPKVRADVTGTVVLGAAGNFEILAKSGISTDPPSTITGDMGVSPVTSSAVTGFSLAEDATNLFWKSTQVSGNVYATDNIEPTPSNLTT